MDLFPRKMYIHTKFGVKRGSTISQNRVAVAAVTYNPHNVIDITQHTFNPQS